MTGNDVDVDADDVDELTGKENERKPEEKSSSTNPNGKAMHVRNSQYGFLCLSVWLEAYRQWSFVRCSDGHSADF